MDEVLKIRIEGTVKGLQDSLDEALALTEDLASELDNVSKGVQKTTKTWAIFKKSSFIMQELDRATNGVASQLVLVGKELIAAAAAAGVFAAALIATGIGAIVVAVGLLVLYWEDIVKFTTGWSIELADAQEEIKKMGDEAERGLEAYKNQDNVLKLQGVTQKEINRGVINRLVGVINIRKAELLLAKEQLENLTTYAAQVKKWATRSVYLFTMGPIAAAMALDKVFNTQNARRIKELADDTIAWIESFVGVEDAAEEVKGLNEQIGKLQNQAAGLKLANIEIDKKEAKEAAEELAARIAREAKITLQVEKILLDDDADREIFDVAEINKIAALNDLINAPKSWDVKGIEEANFLIKEQEKAINGLLNSFKWLTEGQKEYVRSLSTGEIEAYREKLENLEDTSQMLANAVGLSLIHI